LCKGLRLSREGRGVYRVLVGKPEGKRPLGGPRHRWEDNIKMDLQDVECESMDWIELAQDRDRWRALETHNKAQEDSAGTDIGALFDYPNRVFRAFSSVVRQMPGYNSQRRGTAHTSQFTSQFFFLVIVIVFLVIFMCDPSSVFCVLFVCKCILLPPGVNPIAVK
jgi:hypothetical protein